ncbi:S-layer homology domain-containing protein [Patescibacteria group bacterium]
MKKHVRLVSFIVGLTLFLTTIVPVHAFFVYEVIIPIIFNPIYVDDVNGNDTNSGLDTSNAVKTITKAMDIAENGAFTTYQVLIAEGNYDAETFPLVIADKDISVFGGYYNDFAERDSENHQTEIQGNTDNAELYTFDISNASSTISGLRIYGQSAGASVINISNGDGAGHNLNINAVEVDDSFVLGGAIFANLESGDNLSVFNNYIHDTEAWISAITVEGDHSLAYVYGNFIYNTTASTQVNVTNTLVYNNIISKGTAIGLNLKNGSAAYNNTIVDNATGINVPSGVSGAKFFNNLIADNSSSGVALGSSATFDYNAYFGNGTILLGANEVECDPGLSYTSNQSDYQLADGSECIDKGTEITEVGVDYFGETRKKDGNADSVYATDPGAHEADGDEADTPAISNDDASPDAFSPDGDGVNDTSTITFELNVTSNIMVEIYQDTTLITEVVNEVMESGTHNVIWNGTDASSDPAGEGNYTYKITAENSEGTDDVDGTVAINFNANAQVCAAFTDVAFNDPLCPAIEFVKNQGIFQGYPDGTFRPNDVINRVESTKVILEGFSIPLLADDNTNQGFTDVIVNEWYMTYLRTGKDEGVVQGYPDGTFRPNQQVVRVELLKIFFETSGEDLSSVTITGDPYPDTVVDTETSWYMPYVQFSKDYALVDADNQGNFNPAEGMKRGDVAELFYRFHQEGFI